MMPVAGYYSLALTNISVDETRRSLPLIVRETWERPTLSLK